MKQHITEKQLNEISDEQYNFWRLWLEDHHMFGETSLMTNIGMMIEFLLQSDKKIWLITETFGNGMTDVNVRLYGSRHYRGFFADALWEAVKEVLKKESQG